ncbi:hypothetical protein WKW77_25800 [Variovorax ureilyticus]|uniref:Uncharacterized protein n=1 Tax=Variovorax ureilyticus TaxID=1836198 RepID=A0ABU8VLG6_9BURK
MPLVPLAWGQDAALAEMLLGALPARLYARLYGRLGQTVSVGMTRYWDVPPWRQTFICFFWGADVAL